MLLDIGTALKNLMRFKRKEMKLFVLIVTATLLSLEINAQELAVYNHCEVSTGEINEGEWIVIFYQDSVRINNLDTGAFLSLEVVDKWETEDKYETYIVSAGAFYGNLIRGEGALMLYKRNAKDLFFYYE